MATRFDEMRNQGLITSLTEEPDPIQGTMEQSMPEPPDIQQRPQQQVQDVTQEPQQPQQQPDDPSAELIPQERINEQQAQPETLEEVLARTLAAKQEDVSARGGARPDEPDSDLDAMLGDLMQNRNQRARIRDSVERGQRTDAERASRVMEVAGKTRLPTAFIADRLEQIEPIVTARDFNVDEFIKDSPVLAEWIAESDMNYALIKDDVARMGRIEHAFRTPWVGLQAGRAQVETAQIFARAARTGQLSEEDLARVAELDEIMDYAQRFSRGEFGQLVIENAIQAPQLYGAPLRGIEYSIPAMIAGAGLGLAVGSVSGPGSVLTATVGARTFGQVGFTLGVLDFSAEQMTGFAYREMRELRDENGNPMDDDVARVASMAIGYAGGGVGVLPIGVFLRSIPGLEGVMAQTVVNEGIKRALETPAARKKFKDLAADYGRVLSAEVAAEMAQRAIEIAGTEIAKAIDEGNFDPTTFSQAGMDIVEEGIMATRSMLFLSAVGPGSRAIVNAHQSYGEIKNAEVRKKFFETLSDEAAQAKLKERSPEQFEQLMRQFAEAAETETLYIDTDKFNEVFQSANLDPIAVASEIFGDNGESYQQAMESGQIAIPTEKYAAKVAGSAADSALQFHLRTSPETMSLFEANEIRGELESYARDVEESGRDAPAQKIYDDLYGQLIQVRTRADAEVEASRMEAFFTTTARRAGLDPYEYYKEREVIIRSEGIQMTRTGDESVETLLVERLRNNDIPTDREVYGESVTEWLRREGMLADYEGGELTGRDIDVGAVGRNQMLRPSGKFTSLDDAAEAAVELGYINERSEQALLDAIDRDLEGRPVYSDRNFNESLWGIRNVIMAAEHMLESIGVTPEQMAELSTEQIVGLLQGTIDPQTVLPDGAQTLEQVNTSSPEFRSWFGDSKVTDESGAPKIVYHGSEAQFDVFDFSRIGERGRTEGQGFYFTDQEQQAAVYGQPRSFYLSIQNPLDLNAPAFDRDTLISILRNAAERESQAWDQDIRDGFLSGFSNTYELSLEQALEQAADNILEFEDNALNQLGGIVGAGLEPEHLNRAVMEVTGHDGFIADGYGDTGGEGAPQIYVAFTPEQIKSTDNRGTFDPESANVLMQSAFHGSPYRFNQFSLDAIGTGEGAQAFGWGLYFAGQRSIAEYYRERVSQRSSTVSVNGVPSNQLDPDVSAFAELMFREGITAEQLLQDRTEKRNAAIQRAEESGNAQRASALRDILEEERAAINQLIGAEIKKPDEGNIYQVDIPDNEVLLNRNLRFSDQPQAVQDALAPWVDENFTTEAEALRSRIDRIVEDAQGQPTEQHRAEIQRLRRKLEVVTNPYGEDIYNTISRHEGGDRQASHFLNELGIPGLRYQDATSRDGAGESYNYVIWDEGTITVEAVNDQLLQAERQQVRELFQFAGQRAATADMQGLSKAIAMESEGSASDLVWRETGWFRGLDGNWRFEIADKDASINQSVADQARSNLGQKVKLADLLSHDQLFAAYPELGSIDVVFAGGRAQQGSWQPQSNLITLSDSKIMGLKSVLIHEVQHAIQSIEGFAVGGSMADQFNTVRLSPIGDAFYDMLGFIELVTGQQVEFRPSMLEMVDDHFSFISDYSSMIPREVLAQELGTERAEWLRERGYNADPESEVATALDAVMDGAVDALTDAVEFTAADNYERLAGEIEARSVQFRMRLDKSERLEREPASSYDTRPQDAVIEYEGYEVSIPIRDQADSRLAENSRNQNEALIADAYGEPVVSLEPNPRIEQFIREFSYWEIISNIAEGGESMRRTLGEIASLSRVIPGIVDIQDNMKGMPESYLDGIESPIFATYSDTSRVALIATEAGEAYLVRGDKSIRLEPHERHGSAAPIARSVSELIQEYRNQDPEYQRQQAALESQRVETQRREDRLNNYPELTGDIREDLRILAEYAENFQEFSALIFNTNMFDTSDRHKTRLARMMAALDPDSIHANSLQDLEDSGLLDPLNYRGDSTAMEAVRALRSGADKLTVFRGMPKGSKIESGDWVSFSRAYAKGHESNAEDGGRTGQRTVPREHIFWYGADINEWVYINPADLDGIESLEQVWREHGQGKPDGYSNELYQFAGQKSAPWAQPDTPWTEALDMAKKGVSMENIRRQTGWFRGPDNSWRYEISDENAIFIDAAVQSRGFSGGQIGNWFTLGNLLNHERLYEAYPFMTDIEVGFMDDLDSLGQFNPQQGTIQIRSNLSVEQKLSTLLHEIQHAIQLEENFGFGGDASFEMATGVKNALQKMAVQAVKQHEAVVAHYSKELSELARARQVVGDAYVYDSIQRLINYAQSDNATGQLRHIRNQTQWLHSERVNNNPALKEKARTLLSLWYSMPKKHRPRAERNAFLNEFSWQMQEFLREVIGHDVYQAFKSDPRKTTSIIRAAERSYNEAVKETADVRKAQRIADHAEHLHELTSRKSPYQIYAALTGEVESRNVQQRQFMTDLERKNKAPALIQGIQEDGRRINVEDMISVSAGDQLLVLPMPLSMRSQLEQKPTGSRDGARGSLQFADSGPFIINLFSKQNLSTIVHESGHLYLELLGDLVQSKRASDQQANDYATILSWLGASNRSEITVEMHEKFARANELYMREGKSPSLRLANVFAKFWSWMRGVYKSAEELNVEITDEVREVFDRMYATDQEIAEAQGLIGDDGLLMFKSAEDMGVTEQEYQAYVKAMDEVREAEKERLMREVMRPLNREQQAWWKARKTEVREQVIREMNEDPVYRALSILQNRKYPDGTPVPDGYPKVKLSKQDILDRYGKKALNGLPRPYVYAAKGGMDIESAASLFGFDSADALITGLINAVPMRQAVDQEVDARMLEQYGDPMVDGTITEQAMHAVHNAKRNELLAREIKALAKKTKKRVTPLQVMREQAERIVANQKNKDTNPSIYRRAEQKAARAALEAATRGDNETALTERQRQLFNAELYRAAQKANENAEKIRKHMTKLSKPKRRGAIGKAGHDYLEQIDGILERFEFRRISGRQLERRQSLADFIREKEESGETLGEEIYVPPELIDEANRTNYRELTNTELDGIYTTVRQLEHFARMKNKLLNKLAKQNFEESVEALTDAVYRNLKTRKLKPFSKAAMNWRDKASDLARQIDASTLKIEQVVEWLDGEQVGGPWQQLIFNAASQAQVLELDLSQQFTQKIIELTMNIPKSVRKRMLDEVQFGTKRKMVRRDLLMVALNAGNESNYNKMLKGMDWDADTVSRMMNELTKEEMDFVQGVWDALEQLWPHIAELEKDLKGIEPERVQPRAFMTQHGEYRGGYFPMMYDPIETEAGERQLQTQLDKMLGQGYTRATTPTGHTKGRVENFAAPVNLDFEMLPMQVAGVIKDISHRRFLMDAQRLLYDTRVKRAINETMGDQYHKMMTDWIKQIAMDRNVSDLQTLSYFKKAGENLRLNFMIASMGIKATTLVSQFAGLGPAIETVGGKEGGLNGLKWMRRAYSQFLTQPKATHAFVTEKSGEMRHRLLMKDRDLRNNIRRLAGQSGVWADTQRFAMQAIGLVDLTVTIPTWMAAYQKALDAGVSDELAIQHGDRAVRLSQGAAGAKDLVAVASKNSLLMKSLTMFFTPFSAMHARMRDIGHTFGGIKDVPQAAVRTMFLILFPGVLGEIMVGRGPQEDEDELLWATKAAVIYSTLGMPVFRDIVSGALTRFDYSVSPVADTLGRVSNTFKRAGSYMFDDDSNVELEQVAKDVAMTAGFVFGLPAAQMNITGTYLYEVYTGERDVDSVQDFVRGIMYGGKD